ncbi:hypothetical protein CM1_00485 [Mycoplasmoides genitalium M6320]|uniref:Uncharacterized protein n=1 Tax=Mycoplasmoides genitalium M6320 TaxID=662945 RepID=A0ABC7ZI46_MYCGT|nr:hypothetical protein CM1_00485 [Mycoplasmoides genitalium M6320]
MNLGEVIIRSKSNQPFFIASILSSPPTKSAPASLAFFSSSVIAKILIDLPILKGKAIAPLNCCSALVVSRFKLTAISTELTNLVIAVF